MARYVLTNELASLIQIKRQQKCYLHLTCEKTTFYLVKFMKYENDTNS